ncbi:MAG: type II toxin-antitoxin system prevent-host-death family antitoxin [Magnetospirillum sp.]|nr:type II toxin-antitoxin system prevent-host-death family antitoxin [Magnetospirillum sp.]
MGKHEIGAGDFKARCLGLLDEVAEHHTELVITKRGRPVARLVPVVEPSGPELFGCLKGTISITGDIVSPMEDEWDANA